MSQTKKDTYFTQLDGIRFVAVALVLFDHWLAEKNVLPLGHLGVTMFFVLSGFLITRILIESKLKDDKIGRSHWFSVKQFIIRRSIRIFPIYFLAIFALSRAAFLANFSFCAAAFSAAFVCAFSDLAFNSSIMPRHSCNCSSSNSN